VFPAWPTIPASATDHGVYHVLLDPVRLYNFHIPVVQIVNALQANNANTGGGFYSQGGQFYYVRGLGLVKTTEDIGEIVVASNNGAPVRIKDIGHVEIGHARVSGSSVFKTKPKITMMPWKASSLMRRGEQTQKLLEGVERKTEEINKDHAPARRPGASLLRPQ